MATQLALPPIAAHRARDRLTQHGGTAHVELRAFPALRMLFDEGDLARVRARGIELPLAAPGEKVLDQLDGFDDVDVQLTDARAGPFRLSRLALERRGGDRPYRTTISGTVTARDLGTFAGSQAGGPLGGFLGGLAGGAVPFGDQAVPIDVNATIRSDDGRPRAVAVDGSVGGVPAGPLVEALAQALAGRF